MSNIKTLREKIIKKIDFAEIYLEDGAPRAAAVRFREAADLLDQFAVEEAAELAKSLIAEAGK